MKNCFRISPSLERDDTQMIPSPPGHRFPSISTDPLHPPLHLVTYLPSLGLNISRHVPSSQATWKTKKGPIQALTSGGKDKCPTQLHKPAGLQRGSALTGLRHVHQEAHAGRVGAPPSTHARPPPTPKQQRSQAGSQTRNRCGIHALLKLGAREESKLWTILSSEGFNFLV